MTDDNRMTTQQVAEYLGVHRRTVQNMVKRGELTPEKEVTGRGRGAVTWKFSPDEVVAYDESRANGKD